MERSHLIILKASDLLIQVTKSLGEGWSKEILSIRPGCLTLIAKLLKTNQVAILLDYADLNLTKWVHSTLQLHLKLQVDAIYTFHTL